VYGAHVSILEQAGQVLFGSFLQRLDGATLITEIGLDVLGDFAHEALERQLANEQIGRLLIFPDFSKRNRARSETVGLFHPARNDVLRRLAGFARLRAYDGALGGFLGRHFFTGCLDRQLLSRRFACQIVINGCLMTSLISYDTPPVDLRAVCCTGG